MKHTLVPFSGTGWFCASLTAMRNRLFRSLLSRFIPAACYDPLRWSFGLPWHPVIFTADPRLMGHSHLHEHFLLLSIHEAQRNAQHFNAFPVSRCQRCAGYDGFAATGHPLNFVPFWLFN